MAVYLVAYRLAPTDDPYPLEEALGAFEVAGRCFDNVWIIRSPKGANEVRDALKVHLGERGRLIVTRCTTDTATARLTADTEEWIKSVLR